MAPTAQKRREKKSFTLSPESVAFLETLRKKRRAASTSSVLEDLLQSARRGQEQQATERAVSDYYSSLSDEKVKEQTEWGEFVLREFPDEVA